MAGLHPRRSASRHPRFPAPRPSFRRPRRPAALGRGAALSRTPGDPGQDRQMKRIATALILIPFIAWVTLASPQWVFFAVLAITGLLAYSEFDNIVASRGRLGAGW